MRHIKIDMPYQVTRTSIDGVLVLEPKVFGDERGFFFESFNARDFEQATGLKETFVQDNHSKSAKGVLRGLHYQVQHAQGKLVRVTQGAAFDVAVDIFALYANTTDVIRGALAEIARVLKPGGLFYSKLWGTGCTGYGLGRQLEPGTYDDAVHYDHYSLLRTIEDGLGIPTHANAAADASTLGNIWK